MYYLSGMSHVLPQIASVVCHMYTTYNLSVMSHVLPQWYVTCITSLVCHMYYLSGMSHVLPHIALVVCHMYYLT